VADFWEHVNIYSSYSEAGDFLTSFVTNKISRMILQQGFFWSSSFIESGPGIKLEGPTTRFFVVAIKQRPMLIKRSDHTGSDKNMEQNDYSIIYK
jgi:hypothetical protein